MAKTASKIETFECVLGCPIHAQSLTASPYNCRHRCQHSLLIMTGRVSTISARLAWYSLNCTGLQGALCLRYVFELLTQPIHTPGRYAFGLIVAQFEMHLSLHPHSRHSS